MSDFNLHFHFDLDEPALYLAVAVGFFTMVAGMFMGVCLLGFAVDAGVVTHRPLFTLEQQVTPEESAP